MKPYLSIEHRRKLIISSQLSLILSIIIIFLELPIELAVISYFTSLTSILHWSYPINGWIRRLDLATVAGGFVLNLKVSISFGIFPVISYLTMVSIAIWIYTHARRIKNPATSSALHSLLHVYGFLALLFQYYIILQHI